jgi:hypothetical protein
MHKLDEKLQCYLVTHLLSRHIAPCAVQLYIHLVYT